MGVRDNHLDATKNAEEPRARALQREAERICIATASLFRRIFAPLVAFLLRERPRV